MGILKKYTNGLIDLCLLNFVCSFNGGQLDCWKLKGEGFKVSWLFLRDLTKYKLSIKENYIGLP